MSIYDGRIYCLVSERQPVPAGEHRRTSEGERPPGWYADAPLAEARRDVQLVVDIARAAVQPA